MRIGSIERKPCNRISNKLLQSFLYYFSVLKLLHSLPIRLRLIDIEKLANDIKEMREASDRELEEYLEYLHTFIPEPSDQDVARTE